MLARVHRFRSWLFVLTVALTTSVCTKDSTTEPPPEPLDISGIWSGSASDNSGPGTLALVLQQNGSSVTGTFEGADEATNLRAAGSVTGSVSGRTLRGQFSGSAAGCDITLSFSAQVAEASMSGSYSGTSCTGPVTSGRFALARRVSALQVSTSTTGGYPGPDGYSVVVDGSQSLIGANATVTIANISAGDRSVQLTGVAGNCVVSGANPRTVMVPSSGIVRTTFEVNCIALTFVSVGAGGDHGCGLTVGGAAYCWGKNTVGELGDGTTTNSNRPVAVTGNLTFVSLSAGWQSTCGLTAGAAAYCWGSNYAGRLGNGETVDYSTTPGGVSGGLAFQSVSAGGGHTCGVVSGGAAYCWGVNLLGELGNGWTVDYSTTPVGVAGGLTFQSVSAGAWHSCGVTSTGAAYCWGGNPMAVSGGLTFESVSAGNEHTCALTISGAAYCWGYNGDGQLGNGTTTDSSVPSAVSGGLTFQSVSAGTGHTCGLTISGAAHCWGHNGDGQLGNGATTNSSVPAAVSGGLTFQSVSAGAGHTCGVTTSGAAYCWGSNYYGELGNSTTTNSPLPLRVWDPR